MSTRVVEQVDDWDEQSFSGGYRGLHDLADGEFSGVVRAGGAELFMTKGVVIGIRRGSIEAFEDASGTQYVAPTPALPLLAIMQERSEEVRAQYYTEKTALSEVDRTLGDGGFTGYIELSENVLSGDYYLVYHRGRSMSVAYVGNRQELVEGDEAFDLANDEVGIYEVRPVDIEAIEIPEPEDDEPEAAVGAGAEATDEVSDEPAIEESDAEPEVEESGPEAGDAVEEESETETDATGTAETDGVEEPTPETAEPDDETATAAAGPSDDPADTDEENVSPERTAESQSATTGDERSGGTTADTAGTDTRESGTESAQTGSVETQPNEPAGERASNGGTQRAHQTESGRTDRSSQPETTEPAPNSETQTTAQPTGQQASQETTEAVSKTERSRPESPADLETRAIPSLDPELTESVDRSGSGSHRGDAPGRSGRSAGPTASDPKQRQTAPVETSTEKPAQAEQSQESAESVEDAPERDVEAPTETETETEDEDTTTEETTERVEELEAQLEKRRERISQLESELGRVETERDDARAKLATVQEERDELEAQAERLESELRRLEEELGAATDAQRRITPQEALDGTDLFVRYHSKGDGTLEKAHDSGIRREDFTENLRLEKHTQFEAAGTAVGGQTYDEFLEDTVEYKFVQWVVRDLLFEIQSTGHTETLSDLYDALPKINRVELNGAVTATDDEGNETTETFDIVFRARMGDPLLVANINDSRQGATEGMMESLITAAERVGKTTDDFASAFLVTQSFFEPAALETVAGATRGGLLSRDKRKSFVNLSRKQGYHLCLVEARNENFHLEVPEL